MKKIYFAIISISLSIPLIISFGCSRSKEPEFSTVSGTIAPGDTLSGNLLSISLSNQDIAKISQKLDPIFKVRDIRPGDTYEIDMDTSSHWNAFRYYTQKDEYFVVNQSTNGLIEAAKVYYSTTSLNISAQGTITSSLWEAMTKEGVDPAVILSFADIFSGAFDFVTDTQPGDEFGLLYKKIVRENGTLVRTQILGARYRSKNEILNAVWYSRKDGQGGYYTPEGESLSRQFLKAPLQYRRISSFFSKGRLHPILKIVRPHLGIDYAAPRGTPVSSIGNGIVQRAGWNGGFGNYVEIKHPNGYLSTYGHLSKIAKGIKKGSRVKQGQLVGSVGSTGLSSGPHLDFRFKKGKTFVNYLKIKSPPLRKITAKEKEDFKKKTEEIMEEMEKQPKK